MAWTLLSVAVARALELSTFWVASWVSRQDCADLTCPAPSVIPPCPAVRACPSLACGHVDCGQRSPVAPATWVAPSEPCPPCAECPERSACVLGAPWWLVCAALLVGHCAGLAVGSGVGLCCRRRVVARATLEDVFDSDQEGEGGAETRLVLRQGGYRRGVIS